MYHPSRGGVRGGKDQFKWDDVKVDKHRENYLGHSIMAPVGRWQKGKDLHWYARDKKAGAAELEAAKEEIRKIKEEEEQLMREALGLAPKRGTTRPQANRIDKHEYAELIKRESAAEDLGEGHVEAAQVLGLGLYMVPRNNRDEAGGSQQENKEALPLEGGEEDIKPVVPRSIEDYSEDDDNGRKKRKRHHEGERYHDKTSRRHHRENEDDDGRHRRQRREDKKRTHESY